MVGEAVEIVDNDPDISPVQGEQDGGVIDPLPGGPGVVTRHCVKNWAGQHAGLNKYLVTGEPLIYYLVCNELQEIGAIVRDVPDVVLGP